MEGSRRCFTSDWPRGSFSRFRFRLGKPPLFLGRLSKNRFGHLFGGGIRNRTGQLAVFVAFGFHGLLRPVVLNGLNDGVQVALDPFMLVRENIMDMGFQLAEMGRFQGKLHPVLPVGVRGLVGV